MASTRYTYTGEDERIYPTYLDVSDPAARRTLVAEPGGSYVIEPAAGQVLPDEDGELQPVDAPVPPDDGRWKAASTSRRTRRRARTEMPAPTIFPGSKRFIGWAKETTPGTAVTPTATMPVDKFDPDPQITWLDDQALRGSMAELYGRLPGPQMGGYDIGGPVFGDTIGFPLHNLLGDYAVSGASAPFTHTFALLNSGSAQPVTHTVTDFTGTTATVGARAYPFVCMTDLTFTWNAEQLWMWEGKALGYIGAAAASAPTPSLSGLAAPIQSWRMKVGVGGPASGGTLLANVSEATITLSRQVSAKNTADGTPDPYVLARGNVGVSGKFTHIAADESPLLNMLNNVQPTLQIIIDNGVAGSGQVALTVDILKGAYKTTKLNLGDVFTYDVEFDAVANATNVGASAGLAPAKVTLLNAVTTY